MKEMNLGDSANRWAPGSGSIRRCLERPLRPANKQRSFRPTTTIVVSGHDVDLSVSRTHVNNLHDPLITVTSGALKLGSNHL